MRAVDIIIQKRDGHGLTREAIDSFVSGVMTGAWPDYQASALLMAIVLRGMSADETWALTDAMARSGDRVDLSDIPGTKVGKHSTGGVGDKVSIVLTAVAAACGVVVPKMSGRGLGHTGGTIDKLESIPGFRVGLSVEEFKAILRDLGTSIISQTASLAPADKKVYALRDVTGTVEHTALIAASVMSKKLAEGSNALVLDVKCGDGAFMKDMDHARALAEAMVAIGARAGVRTEAVITDMDAPLGRSVGNALEIIECLETLKGRGPEDLTGLVRRLAARMVVLAGVHADEAAAASAVTDALCSGRALEKFRRMVERQGGDPRIVDDYSRLPGAQHRLVVAAERAGYLTRLRAGALGRASMVLGAGRQRVEDRIDHGAGVLIHHAIGDAVSADDPILELVYNDDRGRDEARALARQAIEISSEPPPRRQMVLGTVGGSQ